MESFTESLSRLKDIHEKEVLGLQTKLTELNTEKCRDSQRIEELFAKNHQLREQQKALKENVKVLENRLRAGLCDRCMVTQELAKKKQHEYENSHFQSLQHIFILTNEMNGLKEENKNLKEELKRLQNLEERTKHHRTISRESSSTPDSPLSLLSPVNRKASTEKPVSRDAEEEYLPRAQLGEEKSTGFRTSPVTKISTGTPLPEMRILEMNPQRIANQLHGTIAVVRPGSRSCLSDRSSSETTTPPPTRRSPSSPPGERSLSLDSYLRASKPESHEVTSSYETLKLTARSEQLCLLNQHLSLHRFGLRSHYPSAGRENSFSTQMFQTKDVETRTRMQDWEDQPAILDLPGAIVYMRDQRLEGTLQFLEQRERLQFLLAQQQERELRIRTESSRNQIPVPTAPEEKLPLPLQTTESRGRESQKEENMSVGFKETDRNVLLEDTDASDQGETNEATRDYLMDKPLDLSDYGRGREAPKLTSWLKSPRLAEGQCLSPKLDEKVSHQNIKSLNPQPLESEHSSSSLSRLQDPNQGDPKRSEEGPADQAGEHVVSYDQTASPQEHHPNKLASGEAENEPGIRLRLSLRTQKQETDTQPENDDAESVKRESDEPDTSDSEVAPNYNPGILQDVQVEDLKYFCVKDKIQGLQKKRKRGQDPWMKASSKKPLRGKKKIKDMLTQADEQGSPKELDNPCLSSSSEIFEET
ncbi:RBBP8 N-terminal-like protein [Ornithorhynchus anatinus]|uniref:RBBP8 N-terminal-like protein n=1 Tax=Ornithorhynchus anatinus TaxID=9258 RepID=UPI0019D41A53|nr:RBBP8 N-terminal-like protein [Ornithorhynchus anatinus]